MALSGQREHYELVYPVAGQSPTAWPRGWVRTALDADVDNALEPIHEDGAWNAHLAADDTIQAVSSSAADTTQTLYVRGIDTNNRVRIESFTLNGATAVTSAVSFRHVECGWLTAECAGTITVRRTTGPATIFTITIGQLTNYMVHHFNGQYTTYLTYCTVGAGGTMADSVACELRVYPDALDARDPTDGIAVVGRGVIYVDLTATLAVSANPAPMIVPPTMIRVPAQSYIALYGVGEAANNDVCGVLQGFDVLEGAEW